MKRVGEVLDQVERCLALADRVMNGATHAPRAARRAKRERRQKPKTVVGKVVR